MGRTEATAWMVIANRLRDGVVVFLGPARSWVERIEHGRVARSASEGEALLALGRRAEDEQEVVGAALIAVEERADGLLPTKRREVIRARGPSVRSDLGKQAET